MSNMNGIQGQKLELTVVGCSKLKNTEFFSRQDPFVSIEYANTKIRTKTCTDGGKSAVFDEKYQIPLVEGLQELNLSVWNSNTLKADKYIGGCRVQLNKVLSEGYDDSSWMLQTNTGKFGGEVKLIMHFARPPPRTETPVYAGQPYNHGPVYPPHSPVLQYNPPSQPLYNQNHASSFGGWQGSNSPYYPPPASPSHYQHSPSFSAAPHGSYWTHPPPAYPSPPNQPPYYPPGTYPGY